MTRIPTTAAIKQVLVAVETGIQTAAKPDGSVDLAAVSLTDPAAEAALAVVAAAFAHGQATAPPLDANQVKTVLGALLDARTRVDGWDKSKDGKLQKTERDAVDRNPAALADKLAVRAFEPKPAVANLVGLIGSATDKLWLHLDKAPDADTARALKDAVARGVDVRLVLTPGKTLDPMEVLDVLGLEAEGIDVTVRKDAGLPAGAGLCDGKAFTTSSSTGAPTLSSSAAKKAAATAALAHALGIDVEIPPRPLLAPGQVAMHAMPESTHAPIVGLIKSATTSIDLELYQLTDPTVVEALEDAAQRGVKVRVMLEPKTVGAQNFASISARLTKSGVDVKPTPPQFDAHRDVDHAKFMIIDGKEMLFGSGNLVRSGMGGNEAPEVNTRDFWFEDSREQTVADAKKLFDSDWDRIATTPDELTHLVVTPDNADSRVVTLIDSAKQGEPLYVWNQSLDDPEIIARLEAAKGRGVDVHVLLGIQPGGPHGTAKNQATVDALKAKGIDAQLFSAHYLHAKGVITATQAFVGSQNFTAGGLEHNREVGQVFDDPAVVAQLTAVYAGDLAKPKP